MQHIISNSSQFCIFFITKSIKSIFRIVFFFHTHYKQLSHKHSLKAHMIIYIYIYWEREGKRERERVCMYLCVFLCLGVYIYKCICVWILVFYIYIYIYIYNYVFLCVPLHEVLTNISTTSLRLVCRYRRPWILIHKYLYLSP